MYLENRIQEKKKIKKKKIRLIKTSEVIVNKEVIITKKVRRKRTEKIDLEANTCNAIHV